ncbi:MAG: hypothetical protein KKH41_04175 [Candidatus Thermoplasmatota archaeon]|nr:hypothetical protein [Euryarchaeota archaeon]MBU4031501.1 hypothetical protein [Candidatus Thermoplasmatota archaeon]MBU4070878.1 hypothetical protein [Candidatus Thermoplasmatota archaeon]MBU4143578.1 hypothetical protein [Candidatus Thermoplasmatota archaeon]MBU4591765.1 hypothetical protein [Candidatus Thermoplasmatota archaeon]
MIAILWPLDLVIGRFRAIGECDVWICLELHSPSLIGASPHTPDPFGGIVGAVRVADLKARPVGRHPRISNVFITILSGIENGAAHKEVEYSQVGMEVIVIPLARLPEDVKVGRGSWRGGW